MDPRIASLKSILAVHRDDLADAFAEAPADMREVAPDANTWSVARVLEHLTLTERSITKLLAGYASGAPRRAPNATFSEEAFARDLDLAFATDRTRRVKGSQPPGEMTAEQAWSALAESRRALLNQLDQAAGLELEGFSRPHPATQQALDAYQWIAFLALHEARHAAQIREIVARLGGT